MTTTFSLIAGADSSSELTCERHSSARGPSSATITPLLEPTTTMPKAAAGPADSGILEFLDPDLLAGLQATASTSPLWEAANTMPLSSAGPSPKRSFTCFLPPPTLSPHSFFTGSVGEFDQLRRRFDVLVLAAAGRDQQCR
jgi:hypothetical protein